MLLELSTDELYINANTITDGNYTSFSGSVVSDGTLTVTKKFGVCYLNGGITLTAAASGWVTLLDSNAVPAPKKWRSHHHDPAILEGSHYQSCQTAYPGQRRVADYQRLGQCVLD